MDIDVMVELLKNNRTLWVTATVTGIFAVTVSILNAIWLFFQQKKQLAYDKKLENYKSRLDNKNYVSKVRFDAEFLLYRELTVACRNMVNDVYFVYPTYANEPADKELQEKYKQEIYEKAQKAYGEFNKLITSNAPFIPKEFYDRFISIMKLCKENLDVYAYRWNRGFLGVWEGSQDKREAESEAYKRTGEINKIFEALIDDIRAYLNNLDVNE